MAAAEERLEIKFVFLQRINLKSNYKRRFKSLAGKGIYKRITKRMKKLNRTEIIKHVHRESDTNKSSSKNLKLFPARENQFKVQRISILN